MNKPTHRALLVFALALVGFAADQSSKYGVFNWLYQEGQLSGSKEVISGGFKLFVQFEPILPDDSPCDCPFVKMNGPVPPRVNKGALFSLGGGHGDTANRVFAVVSLLAALAISIWTIRARKTMDCWLSVALGLILAGTLGNLFDRVVFGGVRDFLYYYYLIDWPVFNVADCCLVVGAIMLLLQAFFCKPRDAATATTPTVPA